jgi:hypothetical protein
MSIARAFGDAQTTIACLAGGVAGASSDLAGNVVVGRFVNPQATPGVGALGLEFCVRAVISAGVFGVVHGYMPETSSNVFFSILYFACDRGLMSTGVGLARAVVGAGSGSLRTLNPPAMKTGGGVGQTGGGVAPANPTVCGTKSCNM